MESHELAIMCNDITTMVKDLKQAVSYGKLSQAASNHIHNRLAITIDNLVQLSDYTDEELDRG